VGDPMQSIYRFREADVSLFLRVVDNKSSQIFPNVIIKPLSLSENFRSNKSLVTWFNSTFSVSFPKRNDVLSGAIEYAAASTQKSDEQQACEYFLAHNKEQGAKLLVEVVQRELQALPGESDQVAILVRSRPQLELILPLLAEAGIDYIGIDILPLAQQQAVIDVLALCKALCRSNDRLAWLALLRGPWCGLTLEEIKLIAGSDNQNIYLRLQNFDITSLASQTGRARLARFIEIMQIAMAQLQQTSLASLTRWTWASLGGRQTLFGTSIEDIETVFKLIEELESGGDLPSMRELDTALQDLYAQPQSKPDGKAPRLVVSTIHKAKGLQYYSVILPSLASTPASNNKEVLMWAEVQTQSLQSNLLLAPLSKQAGSKQAGSKQAGSKQGGGSAHYEYLRHLDAKRARNEAVRLMYVATTRAENKLVLIGHADVSKKTGEMVPPKKGSLLATVWPALGSHFNFDTRIDESDTKTEPSTRLPQTLVRLPADYVSRFIPSIDWQVQQQLNTDPVVPETGDLSEFEWATSVAIGVGVILHNCLQYAGSDVLTLKVTPQLQRRWRSELLELRVPTQQIDYALQRLRTALKNIQSHTEAHFIFKDYDQADNEFAVSALENGSVKTYRIDRTFVDNDDVRWIVDYKSTPHDHGDVSVFAREQVESRHKQQLEKYGALFQQLDARPIKLAVYFPLLKELISWSYDPVL